MRISLHIYKLHLNFMLRFSSEKEVLIWQRNLRKLEKECHLRLSLH